MWLTPWIKILRNAFKNPNPTGLPQHQPNTEALHIVCPPGPAACLAKKRNCEVPQTVFQTDSEGFKKEPVVYKYMFEVVTVIIRSQRLTSLQSNPFIQLHLIQWMVVSTDCKDIWYT